MFDIEFDLRKQIKNLNRFELLVLNVYVCLHAYQMRLTSNSVVLFCAQTTSMVKG